MTAIDLKAHDEIVYRDPFNPTHYYRMTVLRAVVPEQEVESYAQWSVDQARARGEGNVVLGTVGWQLHAVHESEIVQWPTT